MNCQINKLYKRIKTGIFLFLLACCFPLLASAQIYPYTVTFETGRTHPARKSYASTDTVLCDSIPWTMPGVYLGTMTSNDFSIGAHAARMRRINNTSGPPAYMEMLEDLPLGMQGISFYTAMYSNETGGRLLVLYSIDSGQNWLPAGDTIDVTAQHDSAMHIDIIQPVNQPVRVKIQKINPQSTRIDVDSIVITRFGSGQFVFIQDKMPTGDLVSIYTDSLNIVFDHPVQANTGQLLLHRSGGGVQAISIPSANVRTSDSSALITGVSLHDSSHYYVLLSDSAFKDTASQLYSRAITDTTFWSFNTEDTIILPPIPPLESLDETFLACNEHQNLMGLFKAYNVLGSQTWHCESDGHEDSFAVSISGGFGNNVSAENEDWLISELPFDVSAMSNPALSFWQKAIYDGIVNRTVKISFDYPGKGLPDADSVHWVTLNVPGINGQPANNWEQIEGVDLSPWKNQIFYLAFTYACSTNGAYKLFYDDIKIQEPTKILNSQLKAFDFKVVGSPKPDELTLFFESPRPEAIILVVYDIHGRQLLRKKCWVSRGQSLQKLALPNFAQGFYSIQSFSSQGRQAEKFFVR